MRWGPILVVLVAVSGAQAHTFTSEEIAASLAAPAARVATGAERVTIAPANARVLLVEVGARWYELTPEERSALAAQWREAWRHAVPSGVVAVLDAGTKSPVVRFAPGGDVVAVRAAR